MCSNIHGAFKVNMSLSSTAADTPTKFHTLIITHKLITFPNLRPHNYLAFVFTIVERTVPDHYQGICDHAHLVGIHDIHLCYLGSVFAVH